LSQARGPAPLLLGAGPRSGGWDQERRRGGDGDAGHQHGDAREQAEPQGQATRRLGAELQLGGGRLGPLQDLERPSRRRSRPTGCACPG
jgi:hypothetical protein